MRRLLAVAAVSLAVVLAISACGGSDEPACAAGLTKCGAACVNLTTDAANCGACGSACAGVCNAGACLATCRVVNGVRWCYDANNCGQACNTVCSNLGLPFTISDADWFAAQDTAPECQTINDAFGLGGTVNFGGYAYACIEDTIGTHTGPGGLVGPLFCSSSAGCPASHRTTMDQNGIACGASSRRSLCPCQ